MNGKERHRVFLYSYLSIDAVARARRSGCGLFCTPGMGVPLGNDGNRKGRPMG
jgi:hypothetical protein